VSSIHAKKKNVDGSSYSFRRRVGEGGLGRGRCFRGLRQQQDPTGRPGSGADAPGAGPVPPSALSPLGPSRTSPAPRPTGAPSALCRSALACPPPHRTHKGHPGLLSSAGDGCTICYAPLGKSTAVYADGGLRILRKTVAPANVGAGCAGSTGAEGGQSSGRPP